MCDILVIDTGAIISSKQRTTKTLISLPSKNAPLSIATYGPHHEKTSDQAVQPQKMARG